MKYIFKSSIEHLADLGDASVWIKRDDLIPFSYGGNKARIAAEVFEDMRHAGCSSLVSYGSAGSNLNRVMAYLAHANSIPCHVIIKKELPEGSAPPANELLVRSLGADVVYCSAHEVAGTVTAVLKKARDAGERPYYVYGDSSGQGNEAVLMRASYREYREILGWEREHGIRFDRIFLAVGTGFTMAGLMAAEQEDELSARGSTRIAGISAAREAGTEKAVISKHLRAYGADPGFAKPCLTDRYLLGGYGGRSQELLSFIDDVFERSGIALDPVYTGKAAFGMFEEIRKGNLKGSFLFIHTGGYPGFLDYKGISVID